jgi:hypothetical protein
MPKKTKKKLSKTHENIQGFEIRINSFGEIETNFDVERINTFLNDYDKSKNLLERNDIKNSDDETKEV